MAKSLSFERKGAAAEYLSSGVWRCVKSPTGAHNLEYRNEVDFPAGVFVCVCCGYRRIVAQESVNPPAWIKPKGKFQK